MPATWKQTDDAGDTSRSLSNIGEDLVITGNVTSKGEIQIDGQLHGDIQCASLVLGESSRLEGSVVAEDVVIRGRLKGSVRALRVTLESKCHVEGDLIHQSLAIEQGALFEGKSRRADNPLSLSPTTSEAGIAAKPQLVGERSEEHGNKPATKFRRMPERDDD
jgi:cytoskeletal protein CcmA (bactofilin family)